MSDQVSSHFAEFDLAQWLSYIEAIHATEIDMGLDRIAAVLNRLSINFDFATVITVAGTNGKGTTCAFIEKALISEGKTVAVYSSPHIECFNERLRINQVDVADLPLINAFNKIEKVRGDISLTYYEFTTLAAFLVLMTNKPDVIILEVGLGGRLDATNVIDADIAVITTVDLDHQAFLGNTREEIAVEKAGIMRTNRSAVIGECEPPSTLLEYIEKHHIKAYIRHQAFDLSVNDDTWSWRNKQYHLTNLVNTHIPRNNVATALMVLSLAHIELTSVKVNQWIATTKVAGRTELFQGINQDSATIMLDVGHNPQAARYLSSVLRQAKERGQYKNIHAVFGMLKDKDIETTLKIMQDVIDDWYLGGLEVPRGATACELEKVARESNIKGNYFDNVSEAFKMAQQLAQSNDLILVFGSFFTVANIRRSLVN